MNLSASSLADADLPERIAAMLAASGVDAVGPAAGDHRGVPGGRPRPCPRDPRPAAPSGVQIAVDDFGTGYSSLSYLRDLPIDELKLDRAFILPIADDSRSAALVASTIALAHSLDLRIVAEGVETEEAYETLVRLGCDEAQGYFMSRPIPADALDTWLAAWEPRRVSLDVPRA